MPLHVITGLATAGKTGELHARLFESRERGESPVLVLPSVADVRRASAELSTKAPVGIGVTTLSRWGDGLWQLHGDGRRIIGGASREAFVRRAISDAMPLALGEVATTPGFSAMMARTVATMTAAPDSQRALSESMRAVALVCARYRDLIEAAGLIEQAEAWRVLADRPPAWNGVIAANRFSDFDEPTLALLTGLARVNQVVVALTWEDGFAATRALDASVARFTAQADRITRIPDAGPEGELTELLDRLYAGSAGIVTRGAVSMGLAGGGEAEAALVARFAAEAVRAGVEPDRVVVAFPRLEAVVHHLETAFAAEGVLCDVDIARPVADTALGRSIDALLAMADGAGDRTTAMSVVLGPHSDIGSDQVAALDMEWRRRREGDARRLLGDIAGRKGSLLGKAAAAAKELAREPISPRNGKKWQDFVSLLMSAGFANVSLEERSAADHVAGELERDAGAARAVVRALGEMASVAGAPFTVADVRAALRTTVAGGTAGERPGRVQVTEIPRLRSRRFDTVIIGGLTATEMPVAGTESLRDEVREVFGAGTGARGEEHSRLEFYQAISRARHQLVLVRRESDDRGAEVRPSVLWEEVVDAYRVPGEGADDWPQSGPTRVRVGPAAIASSAPVFTEGRRELRQKVAAGQCSLVMPSRGVLTDARALEALASAETFSATEIEAYLQCPYRWFYERVVRPEEIDTEVDARAIGTLSHRLLKTFYEALPVELGAARVTPENSEEALRLLGNVVERTDLGIRADGVAEELDIARALRWVQTAITDDAVLLPGFAPVCHELPFGGPGEVGIRLGGVGFRGRIDRVDTSDSAVFVTDYKSSRKVSGHARFAEEGKVQAVVYALVASESTGLPVSGSVYRSLRSRAMRGFWRGDLLGGGLHFGRDEDAIGEPAFLDLVERTAALIEGAVTGIRSGTVPRHPANKDACGFCALKAQCEGATR